MGGIEAFAASAREFLEVSESLFVLTRIHKPYHGAVKFVDTILDSGLNKAVNPVHYSFRALRLPLAYALVASMSFDEVRTFWKAYGSGDADEFATVALAVRAETRRWPDKRTVQLLDDAHLGG